MSQTISPGSSYTIPEGYHNGNGIVTADNATIDVNDLDAWGNVSVARDTNTNITLSKADITAVVCCAYQYSTKFSVSGDTVTKVSSNSYFSATKSGSTLTIQQHIDANVPVSVVYG